MTCPLIFRINLSGSRQMTFLSKDWIENSPVGLYWLNAKIDTDSDNIGSPLRLIASASARCVDQDHFHMDYRLRKTS